MADCINGARPQPIATARKHKSNRGNLTVITGLAFLPLSLAVVFTVELIMLNNEKAVMQAAVDAAALSGAQDMSIMGAQARGAKAQAEKFAVELVSDYAKRAKVSFVATPGSDGSFVMDGLAIRPSFFGDMIPKGGFKINVRAVAETLVRQPLCILGHDIRGGKLGVAGAGESKIIAQGCLVHTNSDVALKDSAQVTAGSIRASGTVSGSGYFPSADAGALKIADPFAWRSINPSTPCASMPNGGLRVHSAGVITLFPGTHNTEYSMTGTSTLRLKSGDYHFCKGIKLSGQARLEGQDIVLVFHDTALQAQDTSTVDLEGRRSGHWAGFVLATGRGNTENIYFLSPNVDKLLGTIYLPSSNLYVSSTGNVAESSQWSVIVAQNLLVANKSQLVINSNYANSPVPVPTGVGDKAGGAMKAVPLRLRQ